MSKRSRESLTGGTGDVNPQLLSGIVTLASANVDVTTQVILPIIRLPETSGRAIVMEVLKIMVDLPQYDTTNAAATRYTSNLAFTTYNPNGTAVTFDDPRCFAFTQKEDYFAFTAAGTGNLASAKEPQVEDLTDGAGHGILVATDAIFVTGHTENFSGVTTAKFRWKILYRFKKVSLAEYIGIVQSQQ